MTDIAMHLAPTLYPPAAFDAMVYVLRVRYAMGDALELDRARRVVTQVVLDIIADKYPVFTDQIDARDFVALGRRWDTSDIASRVFNGLVVSHWRSLETLAGSIALLLLRASANRILLDTSEILSLLAIAIVVGHEVRCSLPETADAWIRRCRVRERIAWPRCRHHRHES